MQVDTQDRFYNEILVMSTKNSSANNTLFSKERIETLIGGVKQAKDATKPSGKESSMRYWQLETLKNWSRKKHPMVSVMLIQSVLATMTYIFCLWDVAFRSISQ